jgi:hypothetical protein
MKLTYGKIKAACAKVCNLSASDSRVLDLVNRAMERLIHEGQWVGSTARYAVCVSNKCLTWPREIETILGASLCDRPIVIRGQFYEFLENGPGILSGERCEPSLTLVDRGSAPAFDDVPDTGYKLAIYADGTETAGLKVMVRYYDLNGNKVYSLDGSETIEGEKLSIPAAGNYTYSTYEVFPGGLYEVIKPVTKRVVRLYAYKMADASLFPLAYYEPDEELPVYRRSYIPNLETTGGSCGTTRVTIVGKLRFIPAINDNSILMIQHADAIRLAAQAVFKEECNLLSEAAQYWAMAIKCLNDQARHHRGAGQVDPIRMAYSNEYGGGIYNIV